VNERRRQPGEPSTFNAISVPSGASENQDQYDVPVFRIAYDGEMPVAFVSWALLDGLSEKRFLSAPEQRLKSTEWRCGDRAWVVDVVAPAGAELKFLEKVHRASSVISSCYGANEIQPVHPT
jgi:hypothetical protein